MSDDPEVRHVRLAENQVLYRNVNERIEDVNHAFDAVAAIDSEWICECADTSCITRVSASLAEYEAARANSRTFIVAPGHVFPEVERVVQGNERFTVVEKIGAAAEVAEQNYPRTDGAS